MKLIKNLEELNTESALYSLIIGNFDGVHSGHISIIKNILQKNEKRQLKAHCYHISPSSRKNN